MRYMIKFNYSHKIFVMQMLAYASTIPMIYYGSFEHYLIAIFVYFLNGCLGMIATYHRLLSHGSWQCSRFIEKLFVMFATIGLTGPAIDWVAIHRKHHRYSDTEKDPHSPDYLGKYKVHFLTMFCKVEPKYAVNLLRDPFYKWQRNNYFYINFAYAMILYIIDPFAVIYAWLFPAALVVGLGTAILSTSHRDKKPHNDFALAMLTWGDAFHTNHHDNPMVARLHKYDMTGFIIEKFFKTAI